MKNLIISFLALFFIANAFAQKELVTIFASEEKELFYSPSQKQIWFYKASSFETYEGEIRYIYHWRKDAPSSLNDHWEEKQIWWREKDGTEKLLTFMLPNNKNLNKVVIDSNNIWLSTKMKEKKFFELDKKITFNEAINIIKEHYKKWCYQAEKIGPFYFPTKNKRKQFKKRWGWNDSYSQKFGFFYPDELKNWAKKTERESYRNKDYEELYRLPIHWNGDYLYIQIETNSELKQTFSSTSTHWDWREAWGIYKEYEYTLRKQSKIIKKFFQKNEFD